MEGKGLGSRRQWHVSISQNVSKFMKMLVDFFALKELLHWFWNLKKTQFDSKKVQPPFVKRFWNYDVNNNLFTSSELLFSSFEF